MRSPGLVLILLLLGGGVLPGTGAAQVDFEGPHVLATGLHGPSDLAVADVDENGYPDVVAVTAGSGRLFWIENGPNGYQRSHPVTDQVPGAQSVRAADLDGDGDTDLLAAVGSSDAVVWFENVGGSLGAPRTVGTGVDQVADARAVDLDGDGSPDVLAAARGTDYLVWFANRSSGFGPLRVISGGVDGVNALAAADLDGDGDADPVAASDWDGTVGWFENRPDGFSDRREVSAEIPWARGVEAEDLDRDGKPDLVSVSRTDGRAYWHRNLGEADQDRFSEPIPVVEGLTGAEDLVVRDLDRDGRPDVLGAGIYAGLRWARNSPSGFEEDRPLGESGTLHARAVAVSDVDADGDLDVVLVDADGDADTSGRLLWFESVELEPQDTTATAVPRRPARESDPLRLFTPRPNPFNPATRVAFEVGHRTPVRLAVFDRTGRSVRVLVDRTVPRGRHSVRLDGRSFPGGTYLIRLQAGGRIRSRLVTLLE